MKLKDNLRNMRKKNNLTLEEVGKKINVSKQTVQRYESGQISNVPYDKIVSMANLYGCTPACLMGWEDNLTEENAGMIPEILSDYILLEHIKRLMLLNKEHKQTIYDTIDYLYEKEGH